MSRSALLISDSLLNECTPPFKLAERPNSSVTIQATYPRQSSREERKQSAQLVRTPA
jgi:hypothetical protein